jgi:isopentenyldiphosphate isomerase
LDQPTTIIIIVIIITTMVMGELQGVEDIIRNSNSSHEGCRSGTVWGGGGGGGSSTPGWRRMTNDDYTLEYPSQKKENNKVDPAGNNIYNNMPTTTTVSSTPFTTKATTTTTSTSPSSSSSSSCCTLLERIRQSDATLRHPNYRKDYVAFCINLAGQISCIGQIHQTILMRLLLDDEEQQQRRQLLHHDPTRPRYFQWISKSTTCTRSRSSSLTAPEDSSSSYYSDEDHYYHHDSEDGRTTIISYDDPTLLFRHRGSSSSSSSAAPAAAFCLEGSTNAELESKMEGMTEALLRQGIIPKRHGDRFGVHKDTKRYTCTIDRNAAPYLGIPSIGIQLLCFVRTNKKPNKTKKNENDDDEDKVRLLHQDANKVVKEEQEEELSLWMAQRSAHKSQFPLYWDPTVAGGQPYGMSLRDNMLKEAWEEAGIPASVARQAKPVTCLSQMTSKPSGKSLKHSQYYVYELDVTTTSTKTKDDTFQPVPNDGEVERFELWNVQRLQEEVRHGNHLRPAIRLVVTDFLLRHGILTPDTEPDYVELQAAMHKEQVFLWS